MPHLSRRSRNNTDQFAVTQGVPSFPTSADPLWYKDAIIYEAHVRAFRDSNADGMGDFKGLAEKLDYLQELGVTAIWLLPFFPSPWRDDGYDIADFRSVHPAYGTLKDFQHFLKEAHGRGLKVITELVVNHTSDQHEWFQRSRRAEPGSRWRDFYVWSDSPAKYDGVRIIFKDFEPSNWSWDPVAKAYYWHRFFSHQPDLNFDNPLVRRAVMRTLDFWAEMGVDGFRLDAIPYLFEREGTSCENLPETHSFLQELRRHMDENYPNRMLLAEANMWPEDAVAYFGESGNECHMSFHFPLMPRLFMALRLEDRLPIVEILKRTPVIPETCQWAMFLRNHDELTLEMVTDEERDYMYRSYAADQRARINLGIRRRLAPLLGNDRPRIEVMNALLFSMPGTPVMYYGDEIGMGDNVYLGDRNGVRTPMQWNPDRNAGFSTANPQKLYLPVTIDPAYHYEAINVESQSENPNSLLNWTKRLIALRKQYKAFGRGTLEFLAPTNQRVIAYIRRYQEEVILVVANLSRFAQAVQLDLNEFADNTPVEMFGRTDFPAISDVPYSLTLGANSFFWFVLEKHEAPVAAVSTTETSAAARLPTVFVPSLADIWEDSIRASIASILPRYLQACRWFRAVDRRFRSVAITEVVPIKGQEYQFIFVRAEYTTGDPETYLLAVGCASGTDLESLKARHEGCLIAQIQGPNDQKAVLFSATDEAEFNTALLEAFARRKRFPGQHGSIVAQHNRLFRKLWGPSHPDFTPTLLASAELATSIRFGDRFVMKILANIEPGIHPGVEMGVVLSERPASRFGNAVPFAGSLIYEPESGEKITLGMLHGYVPNQGDAWQKTRSELNDFLGRISTLEPRETEFLEATPTRFYALKFALCEPPAVAVEQIGSYLEFAGRLGQRLAEMHLKLAGIENDPAFSPESFNDFYRQGLYHGFIGLTGRRLEFLRQRYAAMEPSLREMAEKIVSQEALILQKLNAIFEQRVPSLRTRFHGRAHLGHVLVTEDDVFLFDFDGDPALHLSERRIKRCPLRDVASMLISFAYAAQVALRSAGPSDLRPWARFWYSHVSAAFLRGYCKTAEGASFMPKLQSQQQILIDAYLLERALLDIRADIEDKPELAGVPFRVVLHLLDASEAAG
jgi:maltose alpha-D-glucosyltransferase/alpha-amylase